jgi:DNA-binding MarR family transcriptional regulator
MSKPKPSYADQPGVAAVLKLIARPRGATAAEIAKARELEPHTVRSIVSRVESRTTIRLARKYVEKRGTVYSRGLKGGAK